MLTKVTCKDNVKRPELTLGETYNVAYLDHIQEIVYLVGFDEPFAFVRFDELDKWNNY